ncbi:hypothetical protein [Pantoea sp. SJZ147]
MRLVLLEICGARVLIRQAAMIWA